MWNRVDRRFIDEWGESIYSSLVKSQQISWIQQYDDQCGTGVWCSKSCSNDCFRNGLGGKHRGNTSNPALFEFIGEAPQQKNRRDSRTLQQNHISSRNRERGPKTQAKCEKLAIESTFHCLWRVLCFGCESVFMGLGMTRIRSKVVAQS